MRKFRRIKRLRAQPGHHGPANLLTDFHKLLYIIHERSECERSESCVDARDWLVRCAHLQSLIDLRAVNEMRARDSFASLSRGH